MLIGDPNSANQRVYSDFGLESLEKKEEDSEQVFQPHEAKISGFFSRSKVQLMETWRRLAIMPGTMRRGEQGPGKI